MKKIIAIAAILATAQASAFWDSSNGSGNSAATGNADMVGNGSGEGEASFSMEFTGKGRSAGDMKANADTDGNVSGYGYDAPNYAAPMVPVAPAQ